MLANGTRVRDGANRDGVIVGLVRAATQDDGYDVYRVEFWSPETGAWTMQWRRNQLIVLPHKAELHAGCGGTWVPVGYSGLIDRCSKCGEERA